MISQRLIGPASKAMLTTLLLTLPAVALAGFLQPAETGLDDLVVEAGQQADAFMRGDMTRWLALARPTQDVSLFAPFGGTIVHGFDSSPELLAHLSSRFRNGAARVEIERRLVSGDLAVLVMVERAHGEVHGLPDQAWSLRVTQVYRRVGSVWRLVHRHADPMIERVPVATAATLARGGDAM